MQVAVIGLGNMGSPIAVNLARAGHSVRVWNRSRDKARAAVEAGATLAPTPRAAAEGSSVVFTMVADDTALDAVLAGDDGLYAGLGAGAVHVSLSTIAVATAECVAAGHAARGQRLVCAPVFGRPEAAAAAKLYVVAAGAAADVQAAQPALLAIGQRVFVVGERPADACLVKLCGNFMILAAVETMAEAMALAAKGGVDPAALLEVLTGSLFDSPIYRNYGRIVLEERYRPAGFVAPLGLKDMRLVAQSAETLRVPMPVLGVLRDHLLQTVATRGADADWSEIARVVADNAGLANRGS